MPATSLRIAVVGAGAIGRRHIALIRQREECVLAAIVDPAAAAAEHARALDTPRFASLDQLLADARPDGVVLATPNQVHVEQALECIDARVPVLVEKPIAHTVDAARRLCDAAEAAGVPVLVGHHRRHGAIIAKAIDIIAAGTLGRLVAVVGTALFYKPDADGYFDERWRREPGGGPVLINMIHEIDNLRALCGDIVAVQAFASNATRGFAVEDTAAIALSFANGALGTFMLSDTAVSDRSWEHTAGEDAAYRRAHTDEDDCYLIAGTLGSLAVPTMRIERYADAGHRSWHEPFVKARASLEVVDPLARQLAHFCDVIRGRVTPRVSARDGLRNLQIVEAIGEAARRGSTVATA